MIPLVLLYTAVIGFLVSLCIPPRLTRRSNPVPQDATVIGPGYMRVWATDRRINIVFRDVPSATIMFDRKAAKEFGEWLASIEEVKP